MTLCRESAIWDLPRPHLISWGLMEVSCLGLDQDAVANQVAGDQRFDWGLLVAFWAIGFP